MSGTLTDTISGFDCLSISRSVINTNFNNLDTTICAASSTFKSLNLTTTKGPAGTTIYGVPGLITSYAGIHAPNYWTFCDGTELDRASFPGLYTSIGDNFGTPSNSSKFVLPNLQSSSSTSSTVTTLTLSGSSTWIVPLGVNSVNVLAVGGGGAGGAYDGNGGYAGGGGGGGLSVGTVTVTPGQSVSYVVGAGGIGTRTASGINGGNTQFSTVIASGGRGGEGSATGGGGLGGTGTLAAGGAGGADQRNGFPGPVYNGVQYSGGGGGRISGTGGAGGGGAHNQNGSFYGAGGGGVDAHNSISGSGADGVIIIQYQLPVPMTPRGAQNISSGSYTTGTVAPTALLNPGPYGYDGSGVGKNFPSYFGGQQNWPSGYYRVQYNTGGFCVGSDGSWTGWIQYGCNLSYSNDTQVFIGQSAGNYLPSTDKNYNKKYTYPDLISSGQNYNGTGTPWYLDFYHTGGPLYIWFNDSSYSNNTLGNGLNGTSASTAPVYSLYSVLSTLAVNYIISTNN